MEFAKHYWIYLRAFALRAASVNSPATETIVPKIERSAEVEAVSAAIALGVADGHGRATPMKKRDFVEQMKAYLS